MSKQSNKSSHLVPEYLSYFTFRRDQDIQRLAKDIIAGRYDLESEETRLNGMLLSLLGKYEKYKVRIVNKPRINTKSSLPSINLGLTSQDLTAPSEN